MKRDKYNIDGVEMTAGEYKKSILADFVGEKNEMKTRMGIVEPPINDTRTVLTTIEMWDLLIDSLMVSKILYDIPNDYRFTRLWNGLYGVSHHIGGGLFDIVSSGADILDVLMEARKIWIKENNNEKE